MRYRNNLQPIPWTVGHLLPGIVFQRKSKCTGSLDRVVNNSPGSPLLNGHLQSIDHQFHPQVICHRLAYNSSAKNAHNHRQVYPCWTPEQEPGPCINICDVGNPELVGGAAVKSRSTRSGAGRAPGFRTVVRTLFRRLTPCEPATRIRRATRLRPTRTPSCLSSSYTRGAPQVLLDRR